MKKELAFWDYYRSSHAKRDLTYECQIMGDLDLLRIIAAFCSTS